MTFEEAIKKSIRSYFKENKLPGMSKQGKIKYDRDYFNSFEKENFDKVTDWECVKGELGGL